MIKEILEIIFYAPLASLFIVAGLVFLFIAVAGDISGKIKPGVFGRIVSGVTGLCLLVAGLTIHGCVFRPPEPVPTTLVEEPYPSEQVLKEKVWQFSHGDGSVIAERIRLLPDQRIEGYYHPNESRWGIEEGILVFYHESGEPSCRFTAASTEDGRTVLSGPLLFDPDVTHVLREVE